LLRVRRHGNVRVIAGASKADRRTNTAAADRTLLRDAEAVARPWLFAIAAAVSFLLLGFVTLVVALRTRSWEGLEADEHATAHPPQQRQR
jgi:hypothetical protein